LIKISSEDVDFIVAHVKFIELIKTAGSIVNDWQISSSVHPRKCVVKVVKF